MEELKKYLKDKIAECKEISDGFYPGEVDDWDIGHIEGAIDTYEEILNWITEKE